MRSKENENRNWLKKATIVIPFLAIGLIAPLSACSKKRGLDGGPLITQERPLYRQHNSKLYEDLVEMDRKTAEKYRRTGSKAFEREAERRYKSGRRMDEVGIGRPGMGQEEYENRLEVVEKNRS